ncbi:hypothetical protein GCM10017056_47850 [Seohaeicola zhoushanensis]|uniref:Uncharacterized protein n=1 Tax=Seohaeicola zhoushanensis TaxID=1569283 RepID=A0A8J3MC63_9RHOB|nr:hypothetical protein GCM10017056_47850 [Seohaeicola zhoushanensis]
MSESLQYPGTYTQMGRRGGGVVFGGGGPRTPAGVQDKWAIVKGWLDTHQVPVPVPDLPVAPEMRQMRE